MDHKIIVFCALSFVIHAGVILVVHNPTSLQPSAQQSRKDSPLQLSFVKPSRATKPPGEQKQNQQPGSVTAVSVKEPPLPAKNNSKEQERAAPRQIDLASNMPLMKRNAEQHMHISSEFVYFLSRARQSQTPQLMAQITRSLVDKQQFQHQRQQDQQFQEKVRAVTQRLNLAFSEHFNYPRLAQRNGWQGMVKLGLRIEPNGQLSRIRVVSTSGFPVLDQAALETLNRISILQGVEHWLKGAHFDTVLPVEYRLLGG